MPVIDGKLYGSLQIHESFKRKKKDKTPYITVKIYNASSEPYYLRKGTLTYNEFVVTPLEIKIKTLYILEPNMKVKKNLDWAPNLDLRHLSADKQSIVKKMLNCQKKFFFLKC